MYKANITITGIASIAPNNPISNNQLAHHSGGDPVWAETYLGIKNRYWVKDELTSDIGAEAGVRAISNANLTKGEIDLLIVATSSPDRISPSTACIIADNIGLSCPSFDINAVCSGFVYGLNIASSLITSGAYKNILLIASETYSKLTDIYHPDNVYFGDGSGAVVLSKSVSGWISSNIYADGIGKDAFTVPIGGKFKMDGKAVFKTGVAQLPIAINEILKQHNLTIDDIKYLVPHQPGIKMLHTIADTIGLSRDKVITIMDKYANTAAASIPIALHYMCNNYDIQSGDYILLATIGSGWTWGVSIIKWA